jgi:HD-GYP domain-containing protein (c-di-GMP phosphodiesterase class II)
MTRITAGRHAIDGLSLKLNALAWLFGAVISATNPGGIPFAVAFVLASVANIALFLLARHYDWYVSRGQHVSTALRTCLLLTLAGACAFGPFRSDRLWLLAIPLILTDALVERSARRCLTFAGCIGASALAFGWAQHAFELEMAMPLVVLMCAAAAAGVLTRYREREQLLNARDRRMSTLMTTASAVAARDIRSTMLRALRLTVEDLGATAGLVSLVSEEDERVLQTEAAYCSTGEFEFPDTIQVGSGISGYVVKMGQPISVHATESEPLVCDGISLEARAAVSVPLMARAGQRPGQAYEEQPIGALTLLFCHNGDSVEQDDLALLQSLSSLLGAAVSNQRAEERQRLTFLRTLESLATALEARDDYTRGHSHRVCEVSLLIGQSLGLGLDSLEELRIGTTLHDIGKIGVPDAILNKPGRLTDEEFLVMREHPVIGYEICRPLRLSEGVLIIIRNHHEKLDGSGYPDGLKGGELPLALRIVCVADAFDAMSSRRPYRGVMDIQKVLAELGRGAGIQFDPVVVETLRDLLSAGRLNELYREFWQPGLREAA